MKTRLSTEERFWRKVERHGTNACWEWQGAKGGKAYGHLRLGEGTVYAHRWAYQLVNGSIPDGLFVMHSCDNPLCCNPTHLHIGTSKDNAHERNMRGRQARGEKQGNAKLCSEDILSIRTLYAKGNITLREIAEQYGVSPQNIGCVIKGKTWAWLSEEVGTR